MKPVFSHKIYLPLLSGLFSLNAYSEDLSITLYEKNSTKPLSDITVILENTGDFETSNGTGMVNFSDVTLPLPVKVMASGYETWQGSLAHKNEKIYLVSSRPSPSTSSTDNNIVVDLQILVKEKGTGELVEGAMVVLLGSEDYKSSDTDGSVQFSNVRSSKRIKIVATGYVTEIFDWRKNDTSAVFYIEPLSMESNGMEIVADRIVDKISKVKLAANELSGSAGASGDPLKAIAALPGIVSAGDESVEIYMRGSDSDQNIHWVNGAPIGYLYHFGGMWSTINASLIEDINIFLGGFPVEYGDALGGVIDTKLRAPRKDRMRYKLDVSTVASGFLIEGPVSENSKDSFFIGGRRSYIDLVLSPNDATTIFADGDEDDPDRVVQVPQFFDLQALYRHQIKQGHIDLFYYSAGDKIKLELNDSAKNDPQLAGSLAVDMGYRTTGASLTKQLSSKLFTRGQVAYYQAYDSLQIGRDDNGVPFYIDIKEDSFLSKASLQWMVDDNSTISAGITANYFNVPVDAYISRPQTEEDIDNDFTNAEKYRIDVTINAAEISPYVKQRQKWNEQLTTTVGLRLTNLKWSSGFEVNGLSPRASVEYAVSKNTLLTGSWGRYLQVPRGPEIVDEFGNPDLRMTEAEHRTVGLTHKINSLYSIKSEIYHKPMKNLVIAVEGNEPPELYQNKGSGEAYGFDFFLKREAKNRKFGWLAISWAKSTRTNNITGVTRRFSGDQPLTVTAVWGQALPGSWSKWDWSIKAEAHTGKPYTKITNRIQEDINDPDSRWIPEYGPHNGERLPNYYKLDLRISRNILFNESRMKVYLDIQNATFNKNVVGYEYNKDYENYAKPTEVTGLSFFPFIGVELEF